MNDIVKHTQDGFDNFEDDDREEHRGLIQGRRLLFTNEQTWSIKDAPNMPITTYELVVADILRVVQKWKDKKAQTHILAPGEKVPDIAALNAEVPDEEKELYQGKRVGPYEYVRVMYLLHEDTVQKYTFLTGTAGGGIAVRELADAVSWFRKYRGPGCLPRIRLERTWMPTQHGGRYRPSFAIVSWIKPTDGKQLPQREQLLEAPASGQTKAPSFYQANLEAMTPAPAQTVEPPSLRDQMEDEIPF
jgi:hypothetical protein